MSSAFLVSYIVLWCLVGVLTLSVFALYRHFGQMYLNSRPGREDQGPPVDSEASAIESRSIQGTSVRIPSGAPTVLLFMSTTCTPCSNLLSAVNSFASRHPGIETVVVCAGAAPEVTAWATGVSELATVVPDPRKAISAKYRVAATPFLVGTDELGVVRVKGIATEDGLEHSARFVIAHKGEGGGAPYD